MFPVLLFLVTLQNLVVAETFICVPNGDTRGDWGIMEVCGLGTVARGFQLKLEEFQGPLDDTVMNGIALFCTKPLSSEVEKIIRSSEGKFGDWGPVYLCKSGAYLTSFSLRIEPQGHVDDTAANNIMFKCSDGSIIEGNGQSWGDYGSWSESCEMGIRGIQTKVQKPQGIWYDDVALTNVTFTC